VFLHHEGFRARGGIERQVIPRSFVELPAETVRRIVNATIDIVKAKLQ
jgi:hypothetical protein